ncbi:MAG: acetyl esterase/lipase [Halocynthiibacter sp.]|jgi:monoterpene epsilon-lactone hydrolase
MTSLRMRLFGAAIRPGMQRMFRAAADPKPLRDKLEHSARYVFRAPPFVLGLEDRYLGAAGEMPARWTSCRPNDHTHILLYFHGGGYIAGSPQTHSAMIAQLAKRTGLRAFAPAYRLAPEHPLPAAFEDACAAHASLIARGYAPQNIVIGGDSAGGGIALALLAHLCATGQQPAAAFAWSPFTDQTFSGASVQENAATDHFFPAERVHDLAAMILGDLPANDPRASPLYARFPDCPPVLIQASSSEILRDDAMRMDAHLRAQGAHSRLEMWDGAPHVWQMFYSFFPEAREAIENTAQFLKNVLKHSPSEPAEN